LSLRRSTFCWHGMKALSLRVTQFGYFAPLLPFLSNLTELELEIGHPFSDSALLCLLLTLPELERLELRFSGDTDCTRGSIVGHIGLRSRDKHRYAGEKIHHDSLRSLFCSSPKSVFSALAGLHLPNLRELHVWNSKESGNLQTSFLAFVQIWVCFASTVVQIWLSLPTWRLGYPNCVRWRLFVSSTVATVAASVCLWVFIESPSLCPYSSLKHILP